MRSAKRVIYLAAGMVLGMSQAVMTAQAAEEDSAYQWGRWAVLSPAAGGAEPYVAVNTPGADFNARPGDADEFQPEVIVEVPVDDPRDRLPPRPPTSINDPRDRLPPR